MVSSQGYWSHHKALHVGQEDVDLDHFLDAGAGSRENGLEVLNALSGLLLNGALEEIALGVQGDLAGAVDGGGGLDGLGL